MVDVGAGGVSPSRRMTVQNKPAADASFPLAAYLRFCPGGISYALETGSNQDDEDQLSDMLPGGPSDYYYFINSAGMSSNLIRQARDADDRLRQFSLLYSQTTKTPHYLPSLSVLADAVFGRLTGCTPDKVREWADAMVCQYANSLSSSSGLNESDEIIPVTEEDVLSTKPFASLNNTQLRDKMSTPTLLKKILKDAEERRREAEKVNDDIVMMEGFSSSSRQRTRRPRPCGYVFKRGDIAWNCRTCQTDPTCVICDDCFRESNHEGHEVYFHRTSPGGCCDCGDAEAWSPSGCCNKHRPLLDVSPNARLAGIDDPMEAIRSAESGLEAAIETISDEPTILPPLLSAALGVVIGAAVNCIQEAFDGSGVGSDAVQWTRRWADEAARVANNAPYNEDYFVRSKEKTDNRMDKKFKNLQTFLPPLKAFQGQGIDLPESYLLYLRLHNDDVHTFDEVIGALYESPISRRSGENSVSTSNQSLVASLDNAREMTQHVDADGQVTVKPYKTIAGAMRGYQRLKSKGLQCAVVSTAQIQLEIRAQFLCQWLSDVAASHPTAQALVVQAWVQVDNDSQISGIQTWHTPRMIPPWAGVAPGFDEVSQCRARFRSFPPHLASSFLTREASELLHGIALTVNTPYAVGSTCSSVSFLDMTGSVADFYSTVPYRLPSFRYRKSPHALWGTLPSQYTDPLPVSAKHPLLERLDRQSQVTAEESPTLPDRLIESIYVIDTDLRKQQGERITESLYPHLLPGISMVSGVGTIRSPNLDSPRRPPLPSPMDWRNLLATSSFRAPLSPILLVLLLDPYPTKQLRGVVHSLFLSLLTNSRFKARFAGSLAVAYRPLSTLFCAGVGTESDTPLHFTVQIFTAGSLVRALANGPAAERLLLSDKIQNAADQMYQHSSPASSIGVFLSPIAHIIVRCIHTNLLGATKEVTMILSHTVQDEQEDGIKNNQSNPALLPALTYVAGQHPLLTPLPAAPDDCFLDSRSTKHKRLPHLLRDLEYVIETPGTALRLLLPGKFPVYPGPAVLSHRGEDTLTFPAVYARMLRLAQGMDIQKRKISFGHIEYEQNRWLEAFGLSLNFGSTRDALAESVMNVGHMIEDSSTALEATQKQEQQLKQIREALGNMIAALLREMKLWLYREGMLETGLPVGPGGTHGQLETSQQEALQRSTLHVSSSQFSNSSDLIEIAPGGTSESIAISCATYVKMTETQLTLIENALKIEAAQRLHYHQQHSGLNNATPHPTVPVMGDWLRVPHSPFAGDAMSFHLPLHRALAKCVRSVCNTVVSDTVREANADHWWKIPVLDDSYASNASGTTLESGLMNLMQHPLLLLIRPTLRSSNCRVVWSSGPDCTPVEAQKRRARSRAVSANIAVAKIIHSLADHPLRCLAAAQQIERHLWARNGTSGAGMAVNYSTAPLCRQFRDLDLLLVQLSASGMGCGLGVRRVFSLLLSRFNMDGYLCDPELRCVVSASGSNSPHGNQAYTWVNPPRLQDQDHAVILAESFFVTLCVLVTELPPPPPNSSSDDSSLKRSIRRELLHALAAEPRSHSEAMNAATCGISRREETDGMSGGNTAGLFRESFTSVLTDIAKKKNPSSTRASSGPPLFELKSDFCDEYDPSFFHLRRNEHQHAMDVIARLRKQKIGTMEDSEKICLPLVCPPPKSHPRFLPCRLLLHLDSMDAAIRRSLLYAMTNGSWLPPDGPIDIEEQFMLNASDSQSPSANMVQSSADVNVTSFSRRILQSQSSSGSFLRRSASDVRPQFSSEVVASSSVSFLEVLQLLTLQVHTLEECASLHRTLSDLDEESRALSSGFSINTYLGRLIRVPESLRDVWALKPFPAGPLKSKGSGENRGSILGLLIALYEHRSDHGASIDGEGKEEHAGQSDDGHGGARSLAFTGLKWLLRFVHSLVEGAPSVGAAIKCATTGARIKSSSIAAPVIDIVSSSWTISEQISVTVRGMLSDLPNLWPKLQANTEMFGKSNDDAKKARKAAQLRVMARMKEKQAAFAATIDPTAGALETKPEENENESDLCIICRCDDADGENNGPLGYLGHVQRSRVTQLRAVGEWRNRKESSTSLVDYFRVVGHKGCQLRETESMDSKPLVCLKEGSIVAVSRRYISPKYDILSRRVFVRHTAIDHETETEIVTEGWASIQSSLGYLILSPLISLCYSNTRWGSTRPIIRQCGHAAHLKCVEAHTLSLHQRAAGEQPYDGRFAANIADGEFLCPLCKQLSNILIPRDCGLCVDQTSNMDVDSSECNRIHRSTRECIIGIGVFRNELSPFGTEALEEFGSHLYNAMSLNGERSTSSRKKYQEKLHPAIQKWDYEEGEEVVSSSGSVKNILRLLREQLIAWAAVGHSAGCSEASTRGMEKVLPFGVFSESYDPWHGYGSKTKDNHPMLLELKRTLAGCSGLLEVLNIHMEKSLASRTRNEKEATIVGSCLADILEGVSWLSIDNPTSQEKELLGLWSALTALTASTPCHVARDGTIAFGNDARATAAAMWVAKGRGYDVSTKSEPPTPLSILQFFAANQSEASSIPDGWGTLSPFSIITDGQSVRVPFRPAVASAYLYLPILAWDLYTFSASILSSALIHEAKNLPTSREILDIAEYLMVARLVQAIITPDGFDTPEDADLDEIWTEKEVAQEGHSLSQLVGHCFAAMQQKMSTTSDSLLGPLSDIVPSSLLAGLGRAILPFSRALTLLLRSFTACVRERQHRNKVSVKPCDTDILLDNFLCNGELLSLEDGFGVTKTVLCPLPSKIVDVSQKWISLINRWLVATIDLEVHQESNSLVGNVSKVTTGSTDISDDRVILTNTVQGSSHANLVDEMEISASVDIAMDIDEPRMVDRVTTARNVVDEDGFSDEEDMDEAEEMVNFADQAANFGTDASVSGDNGESSDISSSGSDDNFLENDRIFASVSKTSILPYQPSLLGSAKIREVRSGRSLDFIGLKGTASDLSHLGLVHCQDTPTFSLIRLPKSFVEFYNVVNKVKGRDESSGGDHDDTASTETAICLLTGTVMRSGSIRRAYQRSSRPPGTCTLHARATASGIGMFFLVQKCTVLLMHNNKSAYSPSIYVDEHGEEDPQLRRGRPLYLNEARYRALELLWRNQGIPREVAQIRSTSDRVIRDNWY